MKFAVHLAYKSMTEQGQLESKLTTRKQQQSYSQARSSSASIVATLYHLTLNGFQAST